MSGFTRRAVLAGAGLVAAPGALIGELLAAPVTAGPKELAVRYNAWLHLERRLLAAELYPELGHDAERYVQCDKFAREFHVPCEGEARWVPGGWQALPQPSTRAALVLGAVGVSLAPDDDYARWGWS